MPVCAICTNSLNTKSPGIQCSRCQSYLHANGRCSDLTKNLITMITKTPGGRWECVDCRGAGDSGTAVASECHSSPLQDRGGSALVADGVPVADQTIGAMQRMMSSVRTEVVAMRNDIVELRESVTFCSNKITEFESKLVKLNEVLKLAKEIKGENDSLKKELSELHIRLDKVEQDARLNNVEIMDIPEKKDENLNNVLEKIGEYVGMSLEPSLLSSITRVPTKIVGELW